MKIKTSELTDKALDWAVAKALGRRVELNHQYTEDKKFEGWWQLGPNNWQPLSNYSTDWAQGGPIIEREGINAYQMQDGAWQANLDYGMVDEAIYHGPTPLIAAMRCYVASRLGDEVDVPEELLS